VKIVAQIRSILNMILGALVSFVVLVLVLVVCWQVITRMGVDFNNFIHEKWAMQLPFKIISPAWTGELATFLMIWVGMLGGAMAYGSKAHLGIDFFVEKFPKTLQRINEIFIILVVFSFNLGVMCWGGYLVVRDSFDMAQTTPALSINMGYIYMALPIAGVCVAIYSLLLLVESIISFSSTATISSVSPTTQEENNDMESAGGE